jgi:lycopene beta-cyclase
VPRSAGPNDRFDVVVAGAGPAALALGSACAAAGLDVCTIGPVGPWGATYGSWLDELDPMVRSCIGEASAIDVVVGDPSDSAAPLVRHELGREYGMFDNERLRRALDVAPHLDASVVDVAPAGEEFSVATSSGQFRASLVVDATGATPRFVAVRSGRTQRGGVPEQTAYGLVVDGRPESVGGSASVLMDWRQPPGHRAGDPATFLYVLSLGDDRWLVEETSLARRPAVGHDALRARLAARLGEDLTARAEHIELVTIPMAPGAPSRSQPVVGFGAAAGYVHPATGYSVAASLRGAPRVAAAIADSLSIDPRQRSLHVWNAVWPASQRRSRALHDYGLAALLRMAPDELAGFFGAFFRLPTDLWSAYLRVDVDPAEVVQAMRRVFMSLPWSMRARLAAGSPLPFARLLR